MGLPVITVASGGLSIVESTVGGTPVTEATNGYGVPVTKVTGGKPGLPVVFVSETGGPVGPAFARWSTTDKSASVTLSNGDLTASTTSSITPGVRGTVGKSTGKFYWEATMTDWSGTSSGIGLATAAAPFGNMTVGQAVATKAGGGFNGAIYINGSYSGMKVSASAPSNGSIVGIAVDLAAGLIWFRLAPSGNWNNNAAAIPATGTNGVGLGAMAGSVLFPVYGAASIQNGITANFGASPFSGAVPAGFTSGWPA